MDVTLGAALLSLLAVVVAIHQLRQERPLSPLTALLGILTTAGPTAAYLFATGATLNPTAALAALGVGVVLGLVQGRSAQLSYRGSTPVVKQSAGYLVLWAAAYLLTLGLAQLQSAALHAAGILAMVFGSGLATGVNLGLFTRRPAAPLPVAGPRCARCGTELKPGAAFCGACGTPAPAPAPSACASCGQPLKPGARFCPACGTVVVAMSQLAVAGPGLAIGPPEPGVALAGSSAAAARRGGLGFLGCLLVLLLLLLGVGVAGAAYLVAPDVHLEPPSIDDLRDQVPFLQPKPDGPMPPPDPVLDELAEQTRQAVLAPSPARQREQRLRAQLQSTGLPVTGVAVEDSPKGPVLVVGVSYEKLAGNNLGAGGGLKEGLQALLTLARNRSLELSDLHDLTIAVDDAQGRILFSLSAPTSAIEQLRAGHVSEEQFAQSIGFKGESRLGVLDALRKGFTH